MGVALAREWNQRDAAEMLGVSEWQLGRWIRSGWVPSRGGGVQGSPRLLGETGIERARWIKKLLARGKNDDEIAGIVGRVEVDGMDTFSKIVEVREQLEALNREDAVVLGLDESTAARGKLMFGAPTGSASAGKPATQAAARRKIADAHQVYQSRCALDGRPALRFSEWVKHDKVLNPQIYALAEGTAEGARMMSEPGATVAAELKAHAVALQKGDPNLSLSNAMAAVLEGNPALAKRYRDTFILKRES